MQGSSVLPGAAYYGVMVMLMLSDHRCRGKARKQRIGDGDGSGRSIGTGVMRRDRIRVAAVTLVEGIGVRTCGGEVKVRSIARQRNALRRTHSIQRVVRHHNVLVHCTNCVGLRRKGQPERAGAAGSDRTSGAGCRVNDRARCAAVLSVKSCPRLGFCPIVGIAIDKMELGVPMLLRATVCEALVVPTPAFSEPKKSVAGAVTSRMRASADWQHRRTF